jgi:hypothetical protein
MKTFMISALVILGLLLAATAIERRSPGAAIVQKWEYDVVNGDELFGIHRKPGQTETDDYRDMTARFNTLGNEGWELVVIHHPMLIFKRPK